MVYSSALLHALSCDAESRTEARMAAAMTASATLGHSALAVPAAKAAHCSRPTLRDRGSNYEPNTRFLLEAHAWPPDNPRDGVARLRHDAADAGAGIPPGAAPGRQRGLPQPDPGSLPGVAPGPEGAV